MIIYELDLLSQLDQTKYSKNAIKKLLKEKEKMVKHHYRAPMLENHLKGIFKPFKNKHLGKEAIVFATGSSLSNFDQKIPEKYIKIGVNGIFKFENIAKTLNYYFFGDGYHNKGKPFYEGINQMDSQIKKFCCTYKYKKYIHNFNKEREEEMLNKNIGVFDFCHNYFHKNIDRYPMMNHTIIFAAMQFALYCGIKKIYIVGCDVTQSHFYDEKNDGINYHYLYWWCCFKKFVQENYPDVKIISVSPRALIGVFPFVEQIP